MEVIMTSKEELKALLKENLKIDIYESDSYCTSYLNVEISFDGEVISQSKIEYKTHDDYGY